MTKIHCDICANNFENLDSIPNAPVNKGYEVKGIRTRFDRAEQSLRMMHGNCESHGITVRPKGDCYRCIVECVAKALDGDTE